MKGLFKQTVGAEAQRIGGERDRSGHSRSAATVRNGKRAEKSGRHGIASLKARIGMELQKLRHDATAAKRLWRW